MKHKGLVIDDDPRICEAVGEILASLGHEHECAGSQEDARRLLGSGRYSYILLDLEIPVRTGAGFARPVNGENLLMEIHSAPATRDTPVIVMTAHGSDGPGLAVRLMKKGAVDFVNKPFDDDALDRAILETIAKYERRDGRRATAPGPRQPAQAFKGGELVIHERHIELCGEIILEKTGRGHAWEILLALGRKGEHGRCRSLSGRRLAEQLGRRVGENAVVQCVSGLRRKVARVLLREANLTCGENDVIMSRNQGYRLNPSISVRWVGQGRSSPADMSVDPGVKEHGTGDISDDPGDTALNERQRWVLGELERGAQIQRSDIEKRFKCSPRTAKRDLAGLRETGRIEFVEYPRPGHYQLTQPAQVS